MKGLKRIQYNSPVILTFAILSFASLLAGYLTNGVSTRLLFSVYRVPSLGLLFFFRLFGHVLGHVSFEHYFGNIILLLILGPMLEEKYSSKALLKMILITALTTGISNILISNTMLLGASGVVFMLIILSSFVNLEKGRIPLTSILVFVIFVGQEIVQGIYVADNISQLAHIIGGICGAVLGIRLNKNKLKKE